VRRGRRDAAPPVLVEVTRGDHVESRHRGAVAVCAPDGRLVASIGEADTFVYLRSSAKPFQLAPFVASGRFDEYGLGSEALAIMAASHSGEDRHVRLVQEILRRAGLTSAVLQNAIHPPFDGETARRLIRDGEKPTPLRGNCSGKHAGMVLFAKASGWPLDAYWEPHHPIQRLALETVAALADVRAERVATATDGCGVVSFGLPLRGVATAFARLAHPETVPDGSLADALRRIRDAMIRHPDLVAGRRRLDTDLMAAFAGRIVSKGGAEGVLAMGLLDGEPRRSGRFATGPLGAAAKIEDGNLGHRAGGATAIEIARQLGLFSGAPPRSLAEHASPPIADPRGERTGEVRAVFALAAAGSPA
jgi:L-asparaginase II